MTNSRIVRTDIPTQQLFASPLVVDFPQAVEYFPEMALEYMMCWLSRFDLLPGERLECRVMAASIHLMIHKISQLAAGTDISETPGTDMPHSRLWGLLKNGLHRGVSPKSIWTVLESVIVNTSIFSEDALHSKYDRCSGLVLNRYTEFVWDHNLASCIHAPSSALPLLVTFITTQWSTLRTSTRACAALKFLGSCLQARFRPAYDVFHQQQCLKFLAMQSVSSWSASLFRAYVTGIAIAIHPSHDDPEENQMISQAIDCLYEPENLFLACSTLPMSTHRDEWSNWRLRGLGIPDIMTALAQIRPLDPVWVNCRQRLRELAEDENFFVGLKGEEREVEEKTEIEEIGIGEPEIEEWRCNMHEAIKTLDKFFSNIPPQATTSLELV